MSDDPLDDSPYDDRPAWYEDTSWLLRELLELAYRIEAEAHLDIQCGACGVTSQLKQPEHIHRLAELIVELDDQIGRGAELPKPWQKGRREIDQEEAEARADARQSELENGEGQ